MSSSSVLVLIVIPCTMLLVADPLPAADGLAFRSISAPALAGGSGVKRANRTLPPSAHNEPSIRRLEKQSGGRASPKRVGTIMALLAAFQDAGALPPESSPEANRLIKALIQFQAAFMKSSNQAVRQLLREALTRKLGDRAAGAVRTFQTEGWTSQTLEALVDYTASRPSWTQPDLVQGFHDYNVGEEDFDLLAQTFRAARTKLAAKGQDLHAVYAARRREMPGFGQR